MAKVGGHHGEVHPGRGHPQHQCVHALAGGRVAVALVAGGVGQVAPELFEVG